MRGVLLSIALVFGMAGPASAGFVTGDRLFEFCRAELGTAKHVYCLGYIAGVADMVDDPFISKALPPRAKSCVPQELESNRLKEAVLTYLVKNPEERNFQAQVLVVFALSKAFPCRKPAPPQ